MFKSRVWGDHDDMYVTLITELEVSLRDCYIIDIVRFFSCSTVKTFGGDNNVQSSS